LLNQPKDIDDRDSNDSAVQMINFDKPDHAPDNFDTI
jgi:hypothetical protein